MSGDSIKERDRLRDLMEGEWWLRGVKWEYTERQWPDVTLLIPPCDWGWEGMTERHLARRGATRAALELKAEERRPARRDVLAQSDWWIDRTLWRGTSTRHGLTKAQHECLCDLHACGFQTMVAYGAQEAFDWLNEVAGPKPDVLPEGW